MYNFSPQNTYELTGNHDRWACSTATVALKGGYTGKTFNATLKLTGTRDWSNTFEETDEFLAELVAEDDQNDIWKKGYNDKASYWDVLDDKPGPKLYTTEPIKKAAEKLTYNEKTNFIYMQTNHLYRRKLLVGLSCKF